MPKTLKHEMDNGITVWSHPDDYLKLEDNNIVAFDHKTKSKAPEGVHPSYQLQLDVYSFLLKAMGYDTTNMAYLAFFFFYGLNKNGLIYNRRISSLPTSTSLSYPTIFKL